MSYLKKPILLGLLLLLIGGCDNSQFVNEPTSNLKPDKIKEFTNDRKLATKMFTSALTQLENGMLSAIIHRKDENAQFYFTVNHSEKTLHALCEEQETCVGGVYASVHNHKKKGEILHRIYKTKKMQTACAWLEEYTSEFGVMDETLQKEVIGRAWHWVKVCFEE